MADSKPKLVIEDVTPIAKPDTAFSLDKFKSKRAAALANVETLQMGLPHHNIAQAKDFVRLHPDEANYWSSELCFANVPIKGQKRDTLHLIDEDLALRYLPSGKIMRLSLALATKPNDRFFLCDRSQATIAFNYCRGYFEEVPALAKLVRHVGVDSIELCNRVVIEVHTNSYRSVRGRSLLACIMDEVAFWRSEDSATPDVETYGAVQPSLGRIKNSMLILISSAHKRSGLLYAKWKEAYGKNDPHVLVVRGSTLQFNPLFDAKIIERQIASDPALYRAEYLSEWRDDLSSFISRSLLEAAVDIDVLVRPPKTDTKYFAFADPSGGAHDSFTLAIAHRDKDGSVVLDMLYERHAPFNPSEVVAEIAALLKTYRCSHVTGDKYAAQWVVEAFAKVGITYRHSEVDRSMIYLDCLPLFTSGRVRLMMARAWWRSSLASSGARFRLERIVSIMVVPAATIFATPVPAHWCWRPARCSMTCRS